VCTFVDVNSDDQTRTAGSKSLSTPPPASPVFDSGFYGAIFPSNGRMRLGPVPHRSATATQVVRRSIHHGQESLRGLARHYGINQKTVAKRTSTADLPTGPKEPHSTMLSRKDDAVIAAFRCHTLLPFDDCF
jgi:hypothetical protein